MDLKYIQDVPKQYLLKLPLDTRSLGDYVFVCKSAKESPTKSVDPITSSQSSSSGAGMREKE